MFDTGPAVLGGGFVAIGILIVAFPEPVARLTGRLSSLGAAPSDAAIAIHRFQGAVAVALGVGILVADAVTGGFDLLFGGVIAVVFTIAALLYLLFGDDGPPRPSRT